MAEITIVNWMSFGGLMAVATFLWRLSRILSNDMAELRISVEKDISDLRTAVTRIDGWLEGRFGQQNQP